MTASEHKPAGVFFFQAEDGIRDLTVTGVQTCALPISRSRSEASWALSRSLRPFFVDVVNLRRVRAAGYGHSRATLRLAAAPLRARARPRERGPHPPRRDAELDRKSVV